MLVALSPDKFFGLLKGTSTGNFFTALIISAESVDKKISSTNFDFIAASTVQCIKGFPQRLMIFFFGIPFEPPLAVINAAILFFLYREKY
mgnify:CR=1 FL=1